MTNDERMAGEFVESVTVAEALLSTGIQLIHWANDLAFTDAAFGEAWAIETANRMASLSEILNVVYKRLPRRVLAIEIKLPDGMVGVVTLNPDFAPDVKDASPKGEASINGDGGDESSIDELPF